MGDLFTLLLTVGWFAFRLTFYYDALRFDSPPDAPEYYGRFQSLAWIAKTSRQIISISVIGSWMKMQKYVQLVPIIGPMMTAAMATLTELRVFVFAMLFLSIILIFSFGCHIAFGNAVANFSTVLQRCVRASRQQPPSVLASSTC